MVKNPPANSGDVGLIAGLGRSPEGNGYPLQYSCLKNPMDRGDWPGIVHVVAKELDMTACTHSITIGRCINKAEINI